METNENTVLNNTENNSSKKKDNKVLMGGIIAAVILVLAAGIGFGIYNSPSNRLSRQLDLGQKYLEEMDYEQAKIAFEEAIAIDPKCAEAYLGDADANLGMNRYQDAFDILKQGLDATAGDETLISDYTKVGMECSETYLEKNDYESALSVFDELLLYNSGEEVKSSLGECVWKYIEVLLEEKDYDTILKLSEKYGDLVPGLDSESITGKIEASKKFGLIADCLIRIARDCKDEDYEAVFEIMSDDEFENTMAYVDEFGEIKAYDTEYGKIGVYSVETTDFGDHMIYFGDYDGEVRSGEGVWLGCSKEYNYYSVGEWKNDRPNGKQQCIKERTSELVNGEAGYWSIDGSVNEGLWNGAVSCIIGFQRGSEQVYPASFTNGYWDVIEEESTNPSYYVVSEREDGLKLFVPKNAYDNTVGLAGYAVNN